jgi:hypothetical protein
LKFEKVFGCICLVPGVLVSSGFINPDFQMVVMKVWPQFLIYCKMPVVFLQEGGLYQTLITQKIQMQLNKGSASHPMNEKKAQQNILPDMIDRHSLDN